MKKITLLFALLVFSFQSNAQIPAGSVAPDFTATDINGVTHHLADYIAAGKTVIIDVSATWCQPCWNFHNSKALEDIYASYGAEGSNEIVVLFVEGDAATTLADLHGTGTNTRGDWTANTPYPIIDGSTIGDLYQITYFPTLFRICPNGLVSEISASSATSIRASVNASCGVLTGTQNNVGTLVNTNAFCSTTGSPIAKIRNYGENVITSATLNLKENGAVVATKNYTGSMSRYTTKNVTFDALELNPTSDYTVEVVNANTAPVFNTGIATSEMNVSAATPATTDIVVKLYTDNYPTEISWNIKNSAGVIVATGGPYVGSANGGGADANTTKIQNVTLAINDCYSINLLDSYGDGWSYGTTPHGIEIFDASNTSIYNLPVGGFGTTLAKPNSLTTTTLAVAQFDSSTVSLFPNPTTGIVNINTETPVAITIVDITGKVVYSSSQVTKEMTIDLSSLQKGMYLAKIVGDTTTSTEKIILN